MSGNIDISRIIEEASEYLGSEVDLEILTEDKIITCFRFKFNLGDVNCELDYRVADFEIKMISVDINDMVIGFFKVKVGGFVVDKDKVGGEL